MQHPPPGRRVYYLAGPMTGYADQNRDAFLDAAERLRALGAEVYSPHEGGDPALRGRSLGRLLARVSVDLDALLASDAVICLPGSLEALIPEVILAEAYGVPVVHVEDALSA
ncbi:DUF4406 domain-containing protein [Actinopolymorpha pittospori]|uniref:Uncharacterized protein n=1 Tax=Actinopolymorpha pittospori TaxID=648752 RepID=A0A927MWU3_9ACTN|nr:DUF4406 domain-containing protein [Actinopolymorpha pittospori]MBE1606223.1 hypothetical protein [Actinopolymorpha pittospori]